MASEGDDAPLVGRTGTLAAVRTDLLDAGPGGTSAVFVTGESGVGKSRLLRETADALREAGIAVLSGTCLDIGDASPLHPVLQALRRAGVHTEPGPADAGAQDGAGALLERVSQQLRSLAQGRRLLLVLDDLQWADRSTRQLLLYLLAGLGELNLSVLAAVRAESLHGSHPLRRVLAELRRLRSVRVLDLAPLDRDATGELVAAIAGTDVAAEDTERVFKRSGGNPFVVEELARDLRDGRVELSDTLREIFLSRVDELPPHAHEVVHAVAAGVEPVEHALLARVLPLPESELIEAVRAAVAHRFVTSANDGYRLRHRVVAEVLEHEVLPAESAARHRRYAEALEAAPGGPDHARLAHHWRQAGEPERALPSVIAAAHDAERMYGYAESHRQWTLSLELTGDDAPQRTELLAHAAEAAHRCGEHQRALTRIEELATRSDGPGECEIHLRRARYLAAAGRSATAEIEYERALATQACTQKEKASAAANLAELLLHLGRYADAGVRAREALELAERADGSTADLVRASAALGFSLAFREDPDAGLAVIRQAVEIAERSGHPDDVGCAYLHLAELLTGPLNSVEEGVLVARRGAAKLAEIGLGRTYQARLLAIAANGLFRVGDWAEAERVLETAMSHRPSGADAVELLLSRCRLWVGFGDVEQADRDLDAVATILAGGGARHVMPMLTLRAGLAMWQGRHADARAAVQRGLTETRSDDLVLLGVLAWHGLRAEAEAQAGGEVPVDPGAVRRLQVVVERLGRGAGSAAPAVRAVVDGYLDLCAAEQSRIDERNDPDLWARAATSWDRRKQPYPAAYSRLRQAEASFARRPSRSARARAAATAALREAYATARAMGARPFAAEITTVATRARVALTGDEDTVPHPPPGPDPDDELGMLTDREREVLAAVAEGLTNREIGQALFISERTVGVHVGHIFDKLQVRTRVQASRVYLRAA
ncbi:helix-turn-helix transcriptional regulator [Amorphoplanes digitatis]|uniref:DNA-binding CsgD family transcriptional regulator/tetratricopeptide (TPR) repeat protein n=1 Tax=Actinoplanes digitatis TaxID=1868 RepID=A0A7W7HUJ3_9ACTN|nr:LuxR family transcriptional regulator [Actinoplanes digitatis]MBB4761037.1 DNA-binding CsgD family transcriptional regulator/tetratricopeptide (TPR) repeat protein [Actinoplanes digitatis]